MNISSLQTYYLNLDIRSGFSRNRERENTVQKKSAFCGNNNHSAENFKRIRQEKGKARAVGASDNIQTEQKSRKWFGCVSEDHLIAKFPKPSKDNNNRRKQVCFNEKGNFSCDNSKNSSDQKIYAYMSRMSSNDEFISGNFGDSSQLTNWILDSVATCHMTPEISDFITGSLEHRDKHIEVADGHHVTVKQKGQVRIKACDNHGDTFIATLHHVLLAPGLCKSLF